jgi:hypothetical protein
MNWYASATIHPPNPAPAGGNPLQAGRANGPPAGLDTPCTFLQKRYPEIRRGPLEHDATVRPRRHFLATAAQPDMDEADVQQLERLLNAARPHWDACQAHAADGAYEAARQALDRLYAVLDADSRQTLFHGGCDAIS